jgi:hypothetical protein
LFRGTELIVAGKLRNLEKSDFNSTLNADSTEGDFIEPTIVTCFDHPILPPVVATEKKTIGNLPLVIIMRIMMNHILTVGHLEKLWAYLNIQQLMDKYELNKNEKSTAKAKALELALKV